MPARHRLLKYLQEEFTAQRLSKPCLVFCTGDIAFGETSKAPMIQQYGYANTFFTELLAVCGLPRDRLFVVPGNHDVNRAKINSDAQDALVAKAASSANHEAEINARFEAQGLEHQQAMDRLSDYGEFVKERLPHQSDPKRHVYARIVDIDGLHVGVGGFNSAWSCAGLEDDRHLWLAGQWQFDQLDTVLEKAPLRIGLIHHPVDWLNAVEQDLATRRIDAGFHFWLHGHTHNAWVANGRSSTTIAAGALGAGSPSEFGANLVELDLTRGRGKVNLFSYSPRDGGWSRMTVPHHAPAGIWPIEFAPLGADHAARKDSIADFFERTDSTPAASPMPATDVVAGLNAAAVSAVAQPRRRLKVYGREQIIGKLVEEAELGRLLVLYGMRGNGKTAIVRELLARGPFAGRELLRIPADRDLGANLLFRQLAPLLLDSAEQPQLPSGTVKQMAEQLKLRYPLAVDANIWIDMGHLLFEENDWRDRSVWQLIEACRIAFGSRWRWIFELRERPSPSILAQPCHLEQIPGLDKKSLRQILQDAAPVGAEAAWLYDDVRIKQLYGWLGGGHRSQAHPLAIQMLVEVAIGRSLTPLEVLQQLPQEAEQRIEEALLDDLFNVVLSDSERRLMLALALYRDSIPHDHADWLERDLAVPNAWNGVHRRCLLSSDPSENHFFVHGFVSDWVKRRLGLTVEDEPAMRRRAPEHRAAIGVRPEHLQRAIANCWLRQLGTTTRVSQLNMLRAVEAFHHLLEAGHLQELSRIAPVLLGPQRGWAYRRLLDHDEILRERAVVQGRQHLMEYAVLLEPEDTLAWRIVGETRRKLDGDASPKALEAFQKAYALDPTQPAYLANLGKSMLSQGKEGAARFLELVERARQHYPATVNDYVVSIEADALDRVGDGPGASRLRRAYIDHGSRNPVFFGAEAQYDIDRGKPQAAVELLDLARVRDCMNDHLVSILAVAFEKLARGPEASELRKAKLRQGVRNPVLLIAEAEYQLSIGNVDAARRLADDAQEGGGDRIKLSNLRRRL